MDFTPRKPGELAGLLIRRGTNAILICKVIENNKPVIRVSLETGSGTSVKGSIPTGVGPAYLKAACRDETRWTCSYSTDGKTWSPIAAELDGTLLGPGAPGGVYTGTTVGPYASSQGSDSDNWADFSFFESRENDH
jgi:alpha-N-arabinofuranosidase